MRIGTRGSALARAQAELVVAALRLLHPDLELRTVTIKTTGDQRHDVPMKSLGGSGAFTGALERALLEGRIDVAVHSLKDLPVRASTGLLVAAIQKRADPRDVLVSGGVTLVDLPAGITVGRRHSRSYRRLRLNTAVC